MHGYSPLPPRDSIYEKLRRCRKEADGADKRILDSVSEEQGTRVDPLFLRDSEHKAADE